METTNLSVNPSSLVNILTLRYDSSITPNLPRKTWQDFVPTENHFNSEIIEKLICNSIIKHIENEAKTIGFKDENYFTHFNWVNSCSLFIFKNLY